jgi:S1-C subfamily serine protease
MAAVFVACFVVALTFGRVAPRLVSRWLPAADVSFTGPKVVKGAGVSADEQNNIDIYRVAHLATVNITSTVLQRGWFYEVYPVREAGSGFLIDDKGTILTNNHVISGRAPKVQVTMADGSNYDATILAKDPANDLALIKIVPKKAIKPLPLGDSDHLQVGQKVLAIGNPFALGGTLTTGIVSSLGREINDENGNKLEGMVQTDAAINPGNSGGPLLDSQGNVIGVNTAIYSRSGGSIGIGFAMPIAKAKTMIEDYRAGRRFGRPVLGVDVAFVKGDLAVELALPEEGGLLVQEVRQGSAAEAAGLRGGRRAVYVGNQPLIIGGDLIMALDGRAVTQLDAISRAMQGKRPGDPLKVTVYRNGRKVDVQVTLQAAPETL